MPDDSNIYELAEAIKQKRPRQPSADDSRPAVRLHAGEMPAAIDEAEEILLARDQNIYQFGNRLVTVVWDKIRVSMGGEERALRLAALPPAALLDRFERAVRFEKHSQTHGYVPTDCPKGFAERYLARDGKWKAPTLLGVVTAPTLLADGRVLETPGYDPASGLLFDPLSVVFPPVPASPTKPEALAALGRLKEPLKHFPFANDASMSVAISGVLSAVGRRAVATAPMHGATAPVAGSGKSKLMDYASVILTGHKAAVIAADNDDIRNSLAAAMLAGADFIGFDNVSRPIGGELLNQALTQSSVVIRLFHTLESRTVPCSAVVFCNGNNLEVLGDTTRRCLMARLEPTVERPELQRFDFDPVELASQRRAQLVVDALTVLRAWIEHGQRERTWMPTPLGSFEQWSRLVREALIWLGEADPIDTMEEIRGVDPELTALRQMAAAWLRVFGSTEMVTTSQVITAAVKEEEEEEEGEKEKKKKRLNPDLLEAVGLVAGGKDWSRTLGKWLSRSKDRIISTTAGRFRFKRDDSMSSTRWWLEDIEAEAALTAGSPDEYIPFWDDDGEASGGD